MTSKNIELNETLVINYLHSQEWAKLVHILNEEFKITVNDKTNEPVPLQVTESTVKSLSCLLKQISDYLYKDTSQNVLMATKSLFKALRNCVIKNPTAQGSVIKDPLIVCITHEIISNFLRIGIDSTDDCIIMILQFLSNLVTKHRDNARTVWETCNDNILKLYNMPQFSYYTAALLYNILYLRKDLIQFCEDVYECVINSCGNKNVNEYDILLLELLVQNSNFFTLYHMFKPDQRMTVLSLILENDLPSKKESFSQSEVLLHLSAEFKKKSDCILKTVASYVDQIEPEEVVLLLEILAKLSANEYHLKHLQSDKGLLINCAFLLRSIHSIGKESDNNFSVISKISEVSTNRVNEDPTFGFKANLIRLLGNLSWKHRMNQDQAREIDCVPLLLDCCNIDARNPFIIQWTILAIRNLCENNSENQAVIAAMNQQGVIDSSTLQEMGLMLHDDGTNKIGIVPLDSLKK